jgi:hypothetical protein
MKGGEGGEIREEGLGESRRPKKSKVVKKVIFSKTCPERSIKKP